MPFKQRQPFCGGLIKQPPYLWVYATAILLLYGFFKELKPSEAFLTPYLTNKTGGKNLSIDDVNNKVYPVWTYSYLGAALLVFLFTDFIRYNPVILIESSAYLLTRALLLWGTSIFSMQMMQFVYGIATATEVGYYSYIYSAVPFEYYEKLTGPVRAVVLLGRAVSSFVGQALFTTGVLDYYGLNYFSLGSVCLAAMLSLLLPWYFSIPCSNKEEFGYTHTNIQDEPVSSGCALFRVRLRRELIWKMYDFVKFYFRLSLLRWSLWWALAMCGVLQVGNYVQSLWEVIATDNNNFAILDKKREWNGVVEGVTDLVGAGAALMASLLKVNWGVWGELTMGSLTLLQSLLLLTSSYISSVYIAYGCHVIYRSLYAFMITIASSQIAIHLDHASYGLIFGFNTFIALLLQTVMAAIVNTWLQLDTRRQFLVYGCYYYVLTLIYIFAGVLKITSTGWLVSCRTCCIREQRHEPLYESLSVHLTEDTTSSDSDDGIDDDFEKDGTVKHTASLTAIV